MSERPRVFLVTGSASGIGAAICRRLAAPGTAFMVHARKNAEGAAAVAENLRARGAVAQTHLCDLRDQGAAAGLVERTVEAFGGLDVLVSNAGSANKKPLLEVSDDDLSAATDTVMAAFFHLARAAAPHLKEGRDPRIVAVSSFVAHIFRKDVTLFPVTAAAKAGLEALVRTLAIELSPFGVTSNVVVPGYTEKDPGAHSAFTPEGWRKVAEQVPLGRIARPADIANAVAFFADSTSDFVTGQTLHVNGGLHI
ncbi:MULTISPECIES: SDR family oxidoreductase [unclassified Chelatococcus]|uniref:SDR family NAD(P)-dependent oxidoreductase n=1 Tax=unclassified Chelatococcus TaxID=2638111 RepID=UPI001BCB7EFC|nr:MULTISPECIES: SDR family oxidoreductase [unclassified Chelatococcus]MBS7700144.1 SDR family oxidoreductase [Chelatococcus sp. YT9]MBX3556837.1 SDR family oxidoreductase [Chelatococcus sp.]